MNLELAEKVVVITGASKGIGLATALGFASEGARLLLAARDEDSLTAAAAAASAAGAPQAATAVCDVTVDSDVARLMGIARERYGRIDVLINNAAGKLPAGEFSDITDQDWLAGWNQKLQCHIRACRAAYPIMRAQKSGVIVNVLGTAARNPKPSYMSVGISNAALYNFTKSFADLCAPQGIRVLGVAPSGVTTDRWTRLINSRAPAEGKTPEQLQAEIDAELPLGRMARPEDVADAICFAASARASYICGSIITVDGGSTQGVYL
ncbi:MAG: SDR family oxidoreductase [Immundisolibacter sp.]|uniref:SDR family oxidoreductase n=1 Tax=Immundisolibacter sp. TaxID=1934948 RepID=UPI003EE1141D